MRKNAIGARRCAALALTAAVVAVTMNATPAAAGEVPRVVPAATTESAVGGPISRDEVLERAQYWVSRRDVEYSQDQGRAVSDNTGGKYRPDCSGYVSMAWHLPKKGGYDYSTVDLPEVAHSLNDDKNALLPGDIMLKGGPGTGGNDGHVLIFDSWDDAAHTTYTAYEQGGGARVTHHPSGVPYPYWNNDRGFHPYRYNNIIDSLSATSTVADVSGDGFADLLATKPDGTLWLYPNNFNSDRAHPFSKDVRQVGNDWGQYNRVMSGDVNHDGYGDILALTPSGDLYYYQNNYRNSPVLPFNLQRVKIGNSWNGYNRIMAGDVTGDGFVDILATKQDGTMWLYGNNFNSNHGAPYGSGIRVGSYWNDYNRLTVGDVSGDGFADVLATKPDGTLWLFGNYYNSNPSWPYGVKPYRVGSSWNDYRQVMAADVSGDHYVDILATKPDGALRYFGNSYNADAGSPYGGSYQVGSGWTMFNHIF